MSNPQTAIGAGSRHSGGLRHVVRRYQQESQGQDQPLLALALARVLISVMVPESLTPRPCPMPRLSLTQSPASG
ncbi:hypothetical protein AWZ03_009590 [Drosophila navojoa]|uniref:Uncharacterized protein n=1 Tax=Drosophila navojoa TaxID=7232 RepID=A0A484B5M4_DRONA|nr:hypothetical protein AWZ03_009590 [Drosophila navojoa]